VAVLPFTNRSAEADTAYFVDGIHDDLLTELARNPGLKVISRTSMLEYRDTTKNLRQIGEELAVAHILEGAVQRAGDRVRINAQLIDTRSDAHLWAETFDRSFSPEAVFEIQSEIAGAIAAALGQALGIETIVPAPMAAPTANPEAYDLFLRARTGYGTDSEARVRQIIDLYRQALEHDPDFALAMGELGLALTNLYWFFTRRDNDRDEAREWIDRALALQSDNPRLRWILARHLYHGELDYDGALAQLALAEKDLPGSAEVFAVRGFILRRAGRVDEALLALERAALLDPRSEEVLYTLCETHVLLGDLEAALVWQRRLEQVPGVPRVLLMCYELGRLEVLGDIDAYAHAINENPIQPGSDVDRAPLLIQYWQRDYSAAEQAIAAYPFELLEYQFFYLPKSLLHARVAQVAGDLGRAREQAGEALTILEAVLAERPGDYRVMMAKAMALVLSDRADEARLWAGRALDRPTVSKDPLLLSILMRDRLEVLALITDSEELAREIEAYVQLPMKYVHFDGLMLDPLFDPHRDHPAIQALAAKYSRKEPEA
jgi:TolB-like protein/Tfp pilus assembly protein PilF